MLSGISLRRRLQYARGYLDLGMHEACAAELRAINPVDEAELPVLELWIDLWMETKAWDGVIAVAPDVCRRRPASERAWIAWAYALREKQQVSDARAVLLDAEAHHGGSCAVLHYNLACYECLLGNLDEAEWRLQRACKLDPHWHELALEDPDLRDLRPRMLAND